MLLGFLIDDVAAAGCGSHDYAFVWPLNEKYYAKEVRQDVVTQDHYQEGLRFDETMFGFHVLTLNEGENESYVDLRVPALPIYDFEKEFGIGFYITVNTLPIGTATVVHFESDVNAPGFISNVRVLVSASGLVSLQITDQVGRYTTHLVI